MARTRKRSRKNKVKPESLEQPEIKVRDWHAVNAWDRVAAGPMENKQKKKMDKLIEKEAKDDSSNSD